MSHPDAPAAYRVLLVEDEYFLAQDLAEAFKARGAEIVGPVPSVDEALALIADGSRLDGAVLDLNLQGEIAYVVADTLQERGIPFVFATGYDQAVIPPRYALARYCGKPLDAKEVAQALLVSPAAA
ncbi:chemotaxis protein CheY [Methylobacterium variabile]|jgi:ActR/RegA family two-component response regulator|uniref:Chemotaxis protein CheY n=1 Tax=Methylobacterium variabile TaxID=298794 RepID=A0A0J6SZ68_9HYPH|nr:response regulator [Methylobacterium variabile]KMO38922.1 chemotaxis protein CheY [Methylobacterium variabile]